ncbi:hypothetical protein E4U60_002444 [Claviceps pazoutovae]|uniref:Uncharacterized protein n=1 Tax=Claviceps pazoutovae TaxID=1649127 RepID=A0A9P7SL23_9HYPO|nr:hypothetical protein E4U60_002444 [Claviceps pazoutovae]
MSTTIKCDYGYVYYSCQGGKYEGCSDENPCWLYDGPLAAIPDEPETDSTETDSTTIVTVTRHTVAFSEAPRSTGSPSSVAGNITTDKAAASPALCSTCAPTPTFTSSPSTDVTERGSPSSGAIAGAVAAAAIIMIIIIILFTLVFALRRRKKNRASCDASEAGPLGSVSGTTRSEKSNLKKDEFLRMSSDPFAPFGGRADNSDYPYRPSTGTFEMDGVAISGVELPVASIPEVPDPVKTAAAAPDKASESDTVDTAAAAPPDEASESGTSPPTPEPAATLASPSSPKGKITYVNQWNEYKVLTAEEALAAEEAVGGKDELGE